jgi:hypothetical protein
MKRRPRTQSDVTAEDLVGILDNAQLNFPKFVSAVLFPLVLYVCFNAMINMKVCIICKSINLL